MGITFIKILIMIIIVLTILMGRYIIKDSKTKNINPAPWIVFLILLPNFTGLLLYLVFSKDKTGAQCENCSNAIKTNDQYCSNCGYKNNFYNIESEVIKSSLPIKSMVFFFSLLIVVSLLFVSTSIKSNSNSFFKFSTQYFSTNIGNKWVVNYKQSTEEFSKTINKKGGKNTKLNIQSEYANGELYLVIEQANSKDIMTLQSSENVFEYDLSDYEDGKIIFTLINKDARDVKFSMEYI